MKSHRIMLNLNATFFSVVSLYAATFSGASLLAQAPAGKLEYNRDIRPIFADTCFQCHGPDSASRKADLRVDKREVAVEMKAIVPGRPDESEMIKRILTEDKDQVMPPPETNKKLTVAQKDILRRWVAEGAEYQPHWSFIAPQRPALPAVKNQAWVKNPIDQFILSKLEAAGLQPAPEADRPTLARRASLDITGLPPAPEIVNEFVNDASPDAYEKLLDKLLQSPHWGEHRGRYWLDYARYADTHGIHFDNFREMWSYRDWVIKAINQNMPYDQFTIENLAGDLLPNRSLEQLIGSGFNRCNMTTNEGGIIDEEYLVLYNRDRTETVSQVWLGLTANCSTCHDHKFDPISQKEFYEMAAFFNNSTQGARDGNIKDTPPIITVPKDEDRPRNAALDQEIPAARQKVDARKTAARPEFDQWLAAAKPEIFASKFPTEGLYLHAPLNEGMGEVLHVSLGAEKKDVPLSKTGAWKDGYLSAKGLELTQGSVAELPEAGDFEKEQAFSFGAWVKLPANDGSGAIFARMDDQNAFRGWDFWIEGRRVGTHIVNKWAEDALKVVSKEQVPANEWAHVFVAYDGSQKAAGVKIFINGKPQENNVQADSLKSSIKTTVPLKIGQRHTTSPLSGVMLQDARIYSRALAAADVEAMAKGSRFAAILAKPADQRNDQEKNELFAWWLGAMDAQHQALTADVAKLEKEQNEIKARGTIAHVMQEKPEPPTAFILFRGDYDKRRDKVSADTLDILPAFPADFPKNRLGFAKWLFLPEQPLVARVTVNRFWQELFGTGIVKSTGDFGIAGELPSHPELLDWLAIEFREKGWNVKDLFKLIMTSNAYRQAAPVTPEKKEKDPDNRLLSRGLRYRMDAEMIRDYALAASGLLVPKLGGPSVKPYQPDGIWEAIAMDVSNTRSYTRDKGEGLYRRSMYTFWKRMVPPAGMEIFNAPNREFCVVRRERTNTPLQALATLNDEQYVEAAKILAQRTLKEGGDSFEKRINFLGMRLLARPFRSEEAPLVQKSLSELTAYYQAHADEATALLNVGDTKVDPSLNATELAAWTMLVNELMNLDEVLNK